MGRNAFPRLRFLKLQDADFHADPNTNPKRKRRPMGRNAFPRLRFGLVWSPRRSECATSKDQLRAIAERAQQNFGVGWRRALEKVTAGGILLAVEGSQPPQSTLVLTADKPETILQLGTFVAQLAAARANPDVPPQQPQAKTHREFPYYKSGDGYYAIAGRRLIVASGETNMQAALDRLLDGKAAPTHEPAAAAPAGDSLARITVDMKTVRELPGAEENLRLPTSNIPQIFLLGDWLDLFRRSDRVVVEVKPAENTLDLDVRFSASKSEVTPGLEGFFALGEGQQIAPPLQLPHTLYAASWYRDYRAVWDGRAKLLVETSLKAVEEGDKRAESQFALIGGGFRPSELARALGTQFRFVVARQNESVYSVKLDGRLPAAALTVDLRDEEYFNAKAVPVLRAAFGLATASQQPRVRTQESKHSDAELLSLVFDDSEAEAAKGNRIRFNASPTFTVTRGHFVIGSTREIVQQVIDELARQADKPAAEAGMTSRQRTSLAEAGEVAKEFQAPLVRNIVFGQGLSIEEAGHELDVLLKIVAGLGQIAVTSGFDDAGYRYRVQLGPVKD
jgi:hypothetical protein